MSRGKAGRAAGLLGMFVLSTAATCHTDADGSLAYHGCDVHRNSGFRDGELELVHSEPVECPIPIYSVGERVSSAGDLYDYREKWLDGLHDVTTSTDPYYPIASDSDLFHEMLGTTARVARLFVSYRAATGRGYVGDYDIGSFTARAGLLRSSLALKYDTKSPQPLRVTLDGSRNPYGGSVQTWTAAGSGGVEPYRMEWYRSGTPVGSGTSYSASVGTADFPLRVEISDVYGRTAAGFMQVDVDGVLALYTGPTEISPTESVTWTATPSGGFGPYRYDWYEDGEWVADGQSYTSSGYPAWSTFNLRVQITDSRGATDGTTKLINVVRAEDCDVYTC